MIAHRLDSVIMGACERATLRADGRRQQQPRARTRWMYDPIHILFNLSGVPPASLSSPGRAHPSYYVSGLFPAPFIV